MVRVTGSDDILFDHEPGGSKMKRIFSGSKALAAVTTLAVATGILSFSGCARETRITEGTVPRGYPYSTPALQVIDIQVFRDDAEVRLVNMTANSYHEFDLWLNERYVRRVGHLPAGETIRLSLYEFVDEYEEGLRAGGFLSTGRSDPIIKVEIETPDGMLGLIAIPAGDS